MINKNNFYKNGNWGLTLSLDLHDCNREFIRDKRRIEKFVIQLCDLIKVKRFRKCTIVHFGEKEEIAGYSMVQLIETSLVSGHFANKTNNAYLDIFSCAYFDPKKAAQFCKKFFQAKKCITHIALRK